MKALVFNDSRSQINPFEDSLAIRIAYMLTDGVLTGADTSITINIKAAYESFNLARRITLMHDDTTTGEGHKGWMNDVRTSWKALSRKKHRTKDDILEMKQIEKKINGLYELFVKVIHAKMSVSGLPQLLPLFFRDEFWAYNISYGDREWEDEEHIAASTLLKLAEDEDGEETPTLFFLQPHYYRSGFSETHPPYRIGDERAADSQNTWLEPCFEFYNVSALNAVDLEAIRGQLRDAGSAFRSSMDEWIRKSMKESSDRETMQFFKDHILPATESLGTAMQENKFLTMLRVESEDPLLRVWIGAMPVQTIWEFYEQLGVVGEPTIHKLKEALKEEKFQRRWPVMVLEYIHHDIAAPEATGTLEEIIGPARKYISLD